MGASLAKRAWLLIRAQVSHSQHIRVRLQQNTLHGGLVLNSQCGTGTEIMQEKFLNNIKKNHRNYHIIPGRHFGDICDR